MHIILFICMAFLDIIVGYQFRESSVINMMWKIVITVKVIGDYRMLFARPSALPPPLNCAWIFTNDIGLSHKMRRCHCGYKLPDTSVPTCGIYCTCTEFVSALSELCSLTTLWLHITPLDQSFWMFQKLSANRFSFFYRFYFRILREAVVENSHNLC